MAPVVFVIASFTGGTGIHDITGEIDVNSGQLRHTRTIFWVPLREVEPTLVSQHAAATGPPDWRRARHHGAWAGYGHHYNYGTVAADLRGLGQIDQLQPLTPAARAAVAQRVLQLLPSDPSAASDYLQQIVAVAMSKPVGATIDVGDLPP
jgi:hypothetical protein